MGGRDSLFEHESEGEQQSSKIRNGAFDTERMDILAKIRGYLPGACLYRWKFHHKKRKEGTHHQNYLGKCDSLENSEP